MNIAFFFVVRCSYLDICIYSCIYSVTESFSYLLGIIAYIDQNIYLVRMFFVLTGYELLKQIDLCLCLFYINFHSKMLCMAWYFCPRILVFFSCVSICFILFGVRCHDGKKVPLNSMIKKKKICCRLEKNTFIGFLLAFHAFILFL